MPQPIDYNALAKQAGAVTPQAGNVDYAALAKQAGAASSTPSGNPVTPGTPDDDLIRRFGFDPAVIKTSPRYQDALKQHGSGVTFMLTNPAEHPQLQAWRNAPVVSQVEDVGHGAYDVLSGIVQLARHGAGKLGMLSDADVQYGDLLDRVNNQDYLTNVRQGKASEGLRMVGNLLMPVPGGPEAKAGESFLKTVAKGAFQGAKVGAAMPVESGAPEEFAADKLKQAGTGAAFGAAVPTLITGGTKAGTKLWNAATGQVPKEAQEVINAGKQWKVRVSAGDASGKPGLQNAEVSAEHLPGAGMSVFRAGQQQDVKEAAQALQSKYFDKFLDTEPSDFEDVLKAARSGDQRARNLVDKLQNAGTDPDSVQQVSIGLADFRTRKVATELYDHVQDLVEKYVPGNIPLTGTLNALKRATEQARLSKAPDKELLGLLGEVERNIKPKATPFKEPPPGNIAGYAEWMQRKQAAEAGAQQNNSYRAIRATLSDLDDRIRAAMQGENALIGEKGIAQLEQVRNAMEADTQAYVRSTGRPEIIGAQDAADTYYRTARVPFKNGRLAAAASSNTPDESWQEFIKAGKGDRAQNFYSALDAKGQAAIRYNIVAAAVAKATNLNTGTFSPQVFSTQVAQLSKPIDVFFKGAENVEVRGFQNLMAHVVRAGQFAENPPTGQRVIPHLYKLAGATAVGAGMMAPLPAAGAAGAMAGLIGATRALFTTPAGRTFLLAASMQKPGSKAMENVLERATAKLAVNPAIQDANAGTPGPSNTPQSRE